MPVNRRQTSIGRILLKQGRRFKRAVLWPVGFFGFAILFIFCLPILMPIALLSYAREQKRMYFAAEQFRCIECSAILGRASIQRADDEWGRYMEELHRQNPGYRFRVDRTVQAICTECGKQYRFCEKTNRFIESRMPKH
jgi:hypothetical protein